MMSKTYSVAVFLLMGGISQIHHLNAEERTIQVSPVTIRLIRECDIPSRDLGVLSDVPVSEGDQIDAGQVVARLESRQQELAVSMAELHEEVAEEEAKNELGVLAAEDGLEEAELKLKTLDVSLKVARTIEENKSAIEIAKTDESTAKSQLDRAMTAKSKNDSSVSDAEMIRVNAQFRKTQLSVVEAISKHLTYELQIQLHEAELAEQRAIVSQHRRLVQQEQKKRDQATKSVEVRKLELDMSKALLERRTIVCPISGVVSRIHRHSGEFVDAGTPILRVIQLNRLRAEGFIGVSVADQSLLQRKVSISVSGAGGIPQTLQGVVTFIEQEVDPLNQQVRVWVEFENPKVSVYPGMTGEMQISASEPSASESAVESLTSKKSSESD